MRVNEPDVVYQAFPDEAVIIHLALGCYYSADKVGADIFGMAAAGADLNQIQELVAARWEGADAAAVEAFIQQLFLEGLVIESSGGSTAAQAFPPRDPKLPFETPVLNAHRDMQDLLLLDPIHDVDDQGWPNKA